MSANTVINSNANEDTTTDRNSGADTTTPPRPKPEAAIRPAGPAPADPRPRPQATAEAEHRRPKVRYPAVVVQLTGIDGNAFAILGAVQRALRRAGHGHQVAAFLAEATSGDYQHLLQTCLRWVTVR